MNYNLGHTSYSLSENHKLYLVMSHVLLALCDYLEGYLLIQ